MSNPVNIGGIELKLCILQQNKDFQIFVNKPSMMSGISCAIRYNMDHSPLNKFFISDNLTYLFSIHLYPVKLLLLIEFLKASFSECLSRQRIALLNKGLGL